ncbi:hypothetical protein BS17DRAFT_399413 [Gyrodon lividus]|nr:hypothetical protein BS17DRAFT_399413 [Gyrodon lividus]
MVPTLPLTCTFNLSNRWVLGSPVDSIVKKPASSCIPTSPSPCVAGGKQAWIAPSAPLDLALAATVRDKKQVPAPGRVLQCLL